MASTIRVKSLPGRSHQTQIRQINFNTATTAATTPGSEVPMTIQRIAFFSN